MEVEDIKVAIGTNSWGSSTYGTLLRGSSVDERTIKDTVDCANENEIGVFDFAQDYGLGKAQPMMGNFGCDDVIISSKYSPFSKYKYGKVRKSLERDLREFKRFYVDIYWLHLPMDIKENLNEIVELYREGKIKHIGISNFSLDECKQAKKLLDEYGIQLYGVQNHFSLINRDCESSGVLDWCRENGIAFWAWAVLEEGMLVDPRIKTKKSIMKIMFNRKKKKLLPLYKLMNQVGKKYNLTIPQVAEAYCISKGVIPICGCRRPYQVEELYKVKDVQLSDKVIHMLEDTADQCAVRILGVDVFRFMVR